MSVPAYVKTGDPFQDMQKNLDTLLAIFDEIKAIQAQFAKDFAALLEKNQKGVRS